MKTACIIPHYNHPKTVLSVAERAKQYLDTVWIVDDGSNAEPENFEEHAAALGVRLIRHDRNQGKGAALRTAAAELEKVTYESQVAQDELRRAQDALLEATAYQTQHTALLDTLRARVEELEEERDGQGARIARINAQKKELLDHAAREDAASPVRI